jgi:protein involved in polysaccharide export with SLBB domain
MVETVRVKAQGMCTLQNFRRVVTATCATMLLGSIAPPVVAQTAEQMKVFQSLPPEQQQEILQKIGERTGSQQQTAPLAAPALPTSMPKSDITTDQLVDALETVPRLRAGDTVLLTVDIPAEIDRARSEFRRRILDGNPYNLDRMGRLVLQDTTSIVLAGLTAGEAAVRLNADPQLRGFTFGVRLLPVEPELKPFGYDLFNNVPTTFAPATDIPVPADYVVGPGDTLEVQLIGDQGGRYTLTVGRDGVVDFPQLGPIAVAGMRFAAAKSLLEQRVGEQMIGMRASVSMGALRSIQVFVLGEAERPGSYTVSGLSTITNALFASGGVKPIGSLRNIELKRSGNVVTRFDLYDLLLDGDTSRDARLLPGDVIFIPPVGITVAVTGEVQRPAIYEVREAATASEILKLAGGLTPEADPRTAVLERIDERRNRTVLDLDLSTTQGRARPLQTGDLVRIQAIRESVEGAVSLLGQVHRSGSVQYRSGMRLTDLIGSLDELKPLADLHYVLIRRETGPTRTVSVVSADLAAAFADPVSEANILLQPRDRVHVFDLASSRDRVVAPILDDLGRQSNRDEPVLVVGIGGRIKVPGKYPLEPGMTVSDLVRAGGGLDQAAFGGEAELTRYEIVDGEQRQTGLVRIDLAQLRAGVSAADLALQPFDYVVIKEVPLWRDQETITVSGEVRFPGDYPIKRGETLRSVIERAGGLTDLAFPAGSVFMRQELKAREQHEMQILAERMQRDLAALSLQQAQSETAASATQAMNAGQALLADLKNTEAVGRLVINLNEVLSAAPGSPSDIVIRDGDRLVVPRLTQEVTVIGEVQSPTSHLYRADLKRDDYVSSSGGLTQRADKKRIFIIRANGSVAAAPSAAWFSRGGARDVQPGDTIVVPLDAQQMRPLTVWTSVTQILYNIAVAVAAVNSF